MMNSNVKWAVCFLVAFLSMVSCRDKSPSVTTGTPASEAIYKNDGSFDGGAVTLAEVSDYLNKELTIQDAKDKFGPNPLVVEKGNAVQLRYAVSSKKMYQNGVRISVMSLTFRDGVLLDASIEFAEYSD